MIGGLVEHEKVGRVEKHSRHHKTRLLTSGESANLLIHIVAGELERPGKTSEGADRFVWEVAMELLVDREVGIKQVQCLLREVAHGQARAGAYRP